MLNKRVQIVSLKLYHYLIHMIVVIRYIPNIVVKYQTSSQIIDFEIYIINNVDKKTFKWNKTLQMRLQVLQNKMDIFFLGTWKALSTCLIVIFSSSSIFKAAVTLSCGHSLFFSSTSDMFFFFLYIETKEGKKKEFQSHKMFL